MLKKIYLILFTFSVLFSYLISDCKYNNTLELKSLTASFPVWKVVADAMKECGNVQTELDEEYRNKVVPALAANPSLYQIAGVTGSTITPLIEQGLIQPLDELVAKYGKGLKPNQLIKVNGKIMAIAIIVNAQNFMYRKDIFQRLNIKEPRTYNDVLKAAEKIKKSGLVDYPFGAAYQTGWNLAQEFVNVYLAYGGKFFNSRNEPTVNNSRGVRALELMKRLSSYMDPEYLTADSTYVQKQFQQNKIAMSNLWATRASSLENPEESNVVGKVAYSATPSVSRRGNSATTMWWDGLVVAKNISDAEAEAAFRVIMESIDRDVITGNQTVAIWLGDGYQPGPLTRGVFESSRLKAPNYPASSAMSIMHTVLGNNISDFLTGKKSAKATLADIEKDYKLEAKESGN